MAVNMAYLDNFQHAVARPALMVLRYSVEACHDCDRRATSVTRPLFCTLALGGLAHAPFILAEPP